MGNDEHWHTSGTRTDAATPHGTKSITTSFILWRDDVEILFRRGVAFDLEEKNISYDPGADSFLPSIAVSGNDVHVAWIDNTIVKYRRSTDGGASFGSTIDLSGNTGFALRPSIAAIGDNVYVVLSEARSIL